MIDINKVIGTGILIGSRYFLAASIGFVIWYVLFKHKYAYKRIQAKFPKNKDYVREISYSISTIIIFAFIGVLILADSPFRRASLFYKDIQQYGTFYFCFAFILMLFIHDTYFYWIHRLMHHPKLFKLFHLVHHKSVNPSPWAAYAFHPLEAVLEIGVIVVFLFTIPVTIFHMVFFFLFMIVYNVYGHLGYELYPKGFNKTWIGRYINTSLCHNQHHQYFKGNYGLYFTIWDRWMGTLRADYDKKFDEVKSRKPEVDTALQVQESVVS